MDVNVIFNKVVPIDENKNFVVNFKNEEEIINLLLNKKKDYFITNGIIYINDPKNDNKDIDIAKVKKLEEEAKKHIEMEKNNKSDTLFAKNFLVVWAKIILLAALNRHIILNLQKMKYKIF